MTRLLQALRIIESVIGKYEPTVRVVEHFVSVEEQEEYINLRVVIPRHNALIVIREYWRQGELVAYGYYVRVGGYEEWWDNRPHHPEIPTHPHHRHVGDRVEPLSSPSLENFVHRVRELIEQGR